MPLKVGNTFFMSGTGGVNNPAGAHLMVCVGMTLDGGALIVPITSRHDQSDPSCILDVGDHPFIKHESCAAYYHFKKISLAAINAEMASGAVRNQGSVSVDALRRLQVGIVTSDEIAPWAYEEAKGDELKDWLKKKGLM